MRNQSRIKNAPVEKGHPPNLDPIELPSQKMQFGQGYNVIKLNLQTISTCFESFLICDVYWAFFQKANPLSFFYFILGLLGPSIRGI
jgi:hypothetical protein